MAVKKDSVQHSKQEFINLVSKKLDRTKDESRKAVDAVFTVLEDILAKGESLGVVGFGRFHVADRVAREGRNPKTGEKMTIKASKSPKFTAGKLLKESVNAKKK
jgi:DNA-binding protein HU-beta